MSLVVVSKDCLSHFQLTVMTVLIGSWSFIFAGAHVILQGCAKTEPLPVIPVIQKVLRCVLCDFDLDAGVVGNAVVNMLKKWMCDHSDHAEQALRVAGQGHLSRNKRAVRKGEFNGEINGLGRVYLFSGIHLVCFSTNYDLPRACTNVPTPPPSPEHPGTVGC